MSLEPGERAKLRDTVSSYNARNRHKWFPTPGPQTDAYFCQADILLYGGQAGGGKSDLLLGLAFNEAHRALVMRREGVELGSLTERAIEINGSRDGFNGSSPMKFALDKGRQIDFGSALNEGDEASWQGRPHDHLLVDEAVNFSRNQLEFLMGWVRTVADGQRTRTVLASNPPINEDGQWIVEMFAPWLDPQYHSPALPGELRWFIKDEAGEDQEVDGPGEVLLPDGHTVTPLSRTFIPASLTDNPFLSRNGIYKAKLDAMPELYRAAMRDGNFLTLRQDDLRQVIPTQWVKEAQARWRPVPPDGIPMCAMGVDVAQGGKDDTVIAPRYDSWFAPLTKIPGVKTPLATDVAGAVMAKRLDNALVVIDLGGGWGGEAYGHLLKNNIDAVGWLGIEATGERTRDRRIGFVNKRSMAYWRMREALDPSQPGGSMIALPPDQRLVADLCACRYEIGSRGVAVESKEDVVKRLGRSTDDGDAVVMSWTGGRKAEQMQGGWAEANRNRFNPQANLGPRGALARRG